MIKYQKAIKIINKISLNLPDEKISILDSLNRVCAKNILSPIKNPLSNNSAFDGFALLAKEYGLLCKNLVENQKQRIDYWEKKGNKKIKWKKIY